MNTTEKTTEKTPPEDWRRRRDTALRRAGWRCSFCRSQHAVTVRFRTDTRPRSDEVDDLVVVCVQCADHAHHDPDRLYMAIARDVLASTMPADTLPDFVEALKVRCSRLRIRYNAERLARAIAVVWVR